MTARGSVVISATQARICPFFVDLYFARGWIPRPPGTMFCEGNGVMSHFAEHVPSSLNRCRRNGARHRLAHAADASIELTLPDGRRWHLDLLEISQGGVCFGLADGQPLLPRGTVVEQVVVVVGRVRIAGSLTIAHATEEFGAGTICGAEFRPATEADQRELDGLLVALAF